MLAVDQGVATLQQQPGDSGINAPPSQQQLNSASAIGGGISGPTSFVNPMFRPVQANYPPSHYIPDVPTSMMYPGPRYSGNSDPLLSRSHALDVPFPPFYQTTVPSSYPHPPPAMYQQPPQLYSHYNSIDYSRAQQPLHRPQYNLSTAARNSRSQITKQSNNDVGGSAVTTAATAASIEETQSQQARTACALDVIAEEALISFSVLLRSANRQPSPLKPNAPFSSSSVGPFSSSGGAGVGFSPYAHMVNSHQLQQHRVPVGRGQIQQQQQHVFSRGMSQTSTNIATGPDKKRKRK